MAQHVYPFLSYISPRDYTRDLRIFQLRDVAAAMDVVGALEEHGYRYGDTLLNAPGGAPPAQGEPLYPIDLTGIGAEDLILTITRPPLSDIEWGDRKKVHRAWTDLEQSVLDSWSEILEDIARSYVSLARKMRNYLREGFESRQAVRFRECEGAPYLEWNARDGQGFQKLRRENRTAAFLLHRDELWQGGPGYVGVFGMDGTTTMAWANILRHRHSELLEKPGFTMVEITGAPLPERPTRLDFTQSWAVDVILHEVF